MPRPRRFLFNKTLVFVTTSVEEGLLLNPNPLINAIVESALARAQALHPVKICDFLIEPTHGHIMLMVEDPEHVKGFMERFKTESAHAINRLLGRKKRTVWCAGYDSPIVLTPEDAVRKIVYTLTNPVKDGLEETVMRYPGLSSLRMEKKGSSKRCVRLRRWMIPRIQQKTMPVAECRRLTARLLKQSKESHTLTVDRDAWLKCFGIVEPLEVKAWKEKVTSSINEEEEHYRLERARDKKKVIGRERLLNRFVDPSYIPDRKGRRSWVICSDIEYRKRFIRFLKDLIESAREVYCRWKEGDTFLSYPSGLYPPSFPRNSELLLSAALI